MNWKKTLLAHACQTTGVSALMRWLQATTARPYARALNYHDVPPSQAAAFERQLRFYRRHFVPVNHDNLVDLTRGRWRHRKPGLLLSFDDGHRSHAEVVAPLLEKYGFTGWFMIPVGFLDATPPSQTSFASEHSIRPAAAPQEGRRLAMTWAQLRSISSQHVVGCHTWFHRRLSTQLTQDERVSEIVASKRRLEQVLARDIDVFAWVGGEEWSYSKTAADEIVDAGFRLSFMTNNARIRPGADPLQLQRTNVEASYSPALVGLCLSGLLDWIYAPKRRRVNRLTMAARERQARAVRDASF